MPVSSTTRTSAGSGSSSMHRATSRATVDWADLAVATWSTEWNYGPGWDKLLLQAYGLPPDPDRTRYYRLLWDLGP